MELKTAFSKAGFNNSCMKIFIREKIVNQMQTTFIGILFIFCFIFTSCVSGSDDPSDITAPSVPTGLTAKVVSLQEIALSWSASEDEMGVSGYVVYRNGLQLTTVSTTSYNNTGLVAGTKYCYTVSALDLAGNESVQSTQICITTAIETSISKWDLWSGAVELRGVNIWVGRADYAVYEGSLGTGPYGPIFSQQDFNNLAATGCNLVNISHPGLYSVGAPYEFDPEAQANLDDLLAKIEQADMFAVITLRTGPGRSEWTFHWGNDTTTDPENGWFPASYYNEDVWKVRAVQDKWAVMWAYIAERYKNNPIVVGYDLMCEPNGNTTIYSLGDPEEFYPAHANELSDWNQFFPDLISAIRAVDTSTPLIVGGMGYSGADWLSYIKTGNDDKTVYAVHQYEPGEYTHQEPGDNVSYPGEVDWEVFNRGFLENYLQPIADLKTASGVPVVCNEIGLIRWCPNADVFMNDEMDILEKLGVGHAVWAWEVKGGIDDGEMDAFNFRLGPDPNNLTDQPSNKLFSVYKKYWSRNRYRPSNLSFEE